MKELDFQIAFVTSEAQGFPASELLPHNPSSKGWQSQESSEFPQVLILQFSCLVQIRQLQFLSHLSKVASSVELFSGMPADDCALPQIETVKWRRLGFFTLDRKQPSPGLPKSVYITVTSLFLKVVLNECHSSLSNRSNQVGIIAIKVFGQQGSALTSATTEAIRIENEHDLEENEVFQRLKRMEEQAVEREDSRKAEQVRLAIKRLYKVRNYVQRLEERKSTAAAAQDALGAFIFGQEIKQIYQSIVSPCWELSSSGPIADLRMVMAESWIPTFVDDLAQRLSSLGWQSREEALIMLEQEMVCDHSFNGRDGVYAGVLGAIRYTIGDNVRQVSSKAMQLATLLLASKAPQYIQLHQDVPEHIQAIVLHLLDKVGDKSNQVRNMAEDLIARLVKQELADVSLVVQMILKPSVKTAGLFKVGRLRLLNALLKEFRIDYALLRRVIEFAVTGCAEPHRAISNSASELIVTLSSQADDCLPSLSPALRDSFENLVTKLTGAVGFHR